MSRSLEPLTLEDRFVGSLLGLAVGDALGGCFEGQSPDYITGRFPTPEALLAAPLRETMLYTDDTQMAIGVAEALVEDGAICEATLCRIFAANYVPSRGYGWGARRVLEAMEEGRDYRAVAESHFPGGSYGNGAAMRVAPVGLFFHAEPDKVARQAELSALPTHRHPLGIEGAQLLALAVAHCVRCATLDRAALFDELRERCRSDVFRNKVDLAATTRAPAELPALGNGIQAQESVVTAIASFASSPDDYMTAIGRAILLGGDTDTIAAMTGALAGALLGAAAIPQQLLARLEDHPETKGRTYIADLARRLHRAANIGEPAA
jgi:poly(ADP-ribose) glycohydrolase ARH3